MILLITILQALWNKSSGFTPILTLPVQLPDNFFFHFFCDFKMYFIFHISSSLTPTWYSLRKSLLVCKDPPVEPTSPQ